MLAKVNSFILLGIDAQLCEVEVQSYEASKLSADLDFVDVRGQEEVKRAITPAQGVIICQGPNRLYVEAAS